MSFIDKITVDAEIVEHNKFSWIHKLKYAITRTNTFDKVIKNIKDLVKVKEEGEDSYTIKLQFVIHKLNWREVPDFIKMCLDLNVDEILFWGVADWGTEYTKNFKDVAVFLPENPEYEDFVKMLHSDIIKHPKVRLAQDQLQHLANLWFL